MKVLRLDHLVLTVKDIDKSIEFYQAVLGMSLVTFGEGRQALVFGNQKINLHEHGSEFEPKAGNVMPGSADLCFIIDASIREVQQHLHKCGVEIIEGPVQRTGATGGITSLYFQDLDANLIEVSNYNEPSYS